MGDPTEISAWGQRDAWPRGDAELSAWHFLGLERRAFGILKKPKPAEFLTKKNNQLVNPTFEIETTKLLTKKPRLRWWWVMKDPAELWFNPGHVHSALYHMGLHLLGRAISMRSIVGFWRDNPKPDLTQLSSSKACLLLPAVASWPKRQK